MNKMNSETIESLGTPDKSPGNAPVVCEADLIEKVEYEDLNIPMPHRKEQHALQKQFIESYIKNKDSKPVEIWLEEEMQRSLPDRPKVEIKEMSQEIIATLHTYDEKHASLREAFKVGRSKESWLASEVSRVTANMSSQEAAKYLQNLDNTVSNANKALYHTITTKSGTISMNPNLDGYIAEQYHAQTFNMNAEATGSPYRAKVLEPENGVYEKNSVDIVIVDENGNIVKEYQCKYGKDQTSTMHEFEKGEYGDQIKLVPKGQSDGKTTTDVLEAPDGTTSNPLSKDKAKTMQEEAQSGNWNELNWNEYKAKDLAQGIAKQAGSAALMGVAVGVGSNLIQCALNGEEVDGAEVVETALATGADFGIRAATSGAVKVGVEKGVIPIIPKGTPAGTITNIVNVGIESLKVMCKVAAGECTLKEGYEEIEQVSVSTVASVVAATKGATVGATVGAIFGPVGAAVGGFVGGTVAGIAGSTVAQSVVKVAQTVRDTVVDGVKTIASGVVEGVKSVARGAMDIVGSVVGGLSDLLFGW